MRSLVEQAPPAPAPTFSAFTAEAKTESRRIVSVPEQAGQGAGASASERGRSASKCFSQRRQRYS